MHMMVGIRHILQVDKTYLKITLLDDFTDAHFSAPMRLDDDGLWAVTNLDFNDTLQLALAFFDHKIPVFAYYKLNCGRRASKAYLLSMSEFNHASCLPLAVFSWNIL